MGVDLLAGAMYRLRVPQPDRPPVILIFDSGVGGLTVHAEVTRTLPGARCIYAADDAGFPYGDWAEDALIDRVATLFGELIERHRPDLAIVACNTASTLVLPRLRARFAIPFVGTVPAVKPAAERSRSRIIAVLATPGTVRRDYTRDLLRKYAGDCRVELVGSARLAILAERQLRGENVDETEVYQEILPCFVKEFDGRSTDAVVLACTHYPLLVERFRRLAPWPVAWIDPAPAIARRAADLLGGWPVAGSPAASLAVFTGDGAANRGLAAALAARGLAEVVPFRPAIAA